ncbi:MAG: Hsp20/alpha crystallin family protein [Eubacteriales bacterium]|nr:Hsp20/alpha crystallin family protein [Eubacteriales bacterium]
MYGLVPFRKRGSGVTRREDWDFGGLINDFFNSDGVFPAFFSAGNSLRADVRETENEYVVEAEIPGVKKEDIKLDLEDDTLTISVERKFENKEEKDNYLRMERRYGSFSRSFYVDNIKNEDVKAEYKDGILKVTLPKDDKAKAKKRAIDVK